MDNLNFQRVPGQDLPENGSFAFVPQKEFISRILGSIARGPLGQDRGKMLAIEPLACCKRFFFLVQVLLVVCLLGPLVGERGKMLAIEAPKGPKKDPR